MRGYMSAETFIPGYDNNVIDENQQIASLGGMFKDARVRYKFDKIACETLR
jgi:ribosomal protein S12